MRIIEKLHTALRGAIHDATASNTTIDLQPKMLEAREALVKLVRERMSIEKTAIAPRQKLLRHYESEMEKALDQNDRQRANELSQQIEQMEVELQAQQQLLNDYDADIETLKTTIKQAEQTLATTSQQAANEYAADYEAAARALANDEDAALKAKLRAAGILSQ